MNELISRQDAIIQLSHNKNKGDEEWKLAVESDIQTIWKLPSVRPEIIRCKNCKYFEYDHFENVNGIPLIVAHEICIRWGNGDGVKTSENGYCFLAERREVTT